MKLCNAFIFAASILAMSSAQAGDWLHKNLALSDSINMSLDYTSNYLEYNDLGGPVGYLALPWMNISGAGISPTDKISVVLINYDLFAEDDIDHPSESPTVVSKQVVDLHYDAAAAKFTAQAQVLCLQSPDAYKKYFQEVAVVINGKWYKNGDENFRFQLQYD